MNENLINEQIKAIADASIAAWLTPDELKASHDRGSHTACPPLMCEVAAAYVKADETCNRPGEATPPTGAGNSVKARVLALVAQKRRARDASRKATRSPTPSADAQDGDLPPAPSSPATEGGGE